MRQLPKRYLLLSSALICLLFVSCSISKFKHSKECHRVVITKQTIAQVFKGTTASKFKATIDVLKNHLSGIIIVKQTDSVSTHIIFVTEIGMKIFDFEWKNNEMKAVFVFEPLNKPTLINALLSNFKSIFLLDIYNAPAAWCSNKNIKSYYQLEGYKHKYVIADSTSALTSQNIFHKNRKSCFINYTFVPEDKTYTQIKCTQFGFIKIKTELNKINE